MLSDANKTIMLSAIMLSVVMLHYYAECCTLIDYAESHYAQYHLC